MNKYYKLLVLIFLNIAMLQSCSIFRNTQKIKGKDGKRTLWIKKTDLYACNKDRKLGKLDIRYIEDSVMVIIIRNNAGMEGGRLYLYKDRMFLFNRVRKTYFMTKINETDEGKYNSGMTLNSMGNILLQTHSKITNRQVVLKEIGGKARFEILKFYEQNRKGNIPEKIKVYVLLRKQRFCIYCTAENIVTDQYVPVTLLKYQGRYKRVKKINDII